MEISKDDLNYTVKNVSVTPFTFNMAGTTGLTVSDTTVLRTKYYLTFEPDRAVYLLPGATTAGKFSFKYDDTGGLLTQEGVSEFTLDKVGETTYRLYSDTKILTMVNGSFALKLPNDMTLADAMASLVEISTTPKTTPVAATTTTPATPAAATPAAAASTRGARRHGRRGQAGGGGGGPATGAAGGD